MGTRHLTMVVSGGKTRIAQYGQWDGYPSGQGYTVLDFLRKRKGNFKKFKQKLENCRFLNDEDEKKKEKFMKSIGSKDGWMNEDQAEKYHKEYPYMSRDNGAEILNMVLKSKGEVLLRDSTDFAADSLFCEWAYVIDLDKNVLECYGGFNETNEPTSDRFKSLKPESDSKYGVITLTKVYDLDKLPTKRQFVKEIEKEEVEA
jgi:hypothetical protein